MIKKVSRLPASILLIALLLLGACSPAATTTQAPAPAPFLGTAKEVELKYDDGTTGVGDFLSAGLGGYLVDFQAPGNSFTVTKVRMFGETGGSFSVQSFELEVWNKDRKVVYHSNCPISKFSATPAWVDIDIPNVQVNGKFYVHVFTGTDRTGGIFMGADNSTSNYHSTTTVRKGGVTKESTTWGYRSDMWFSDKSKVNWMIRAVGTFVAPGE